MTKKLSETQKYKLFADNNQTNFYHLHRIKDHFVEKGEATTYLFQQQRMYAYKFRIEVNIDKISNWMDRLYLKGKNSIGVMDCNDIVKYKNEFLEKLVANKWNFDESGHWPTHINGLIDNAKNAILPRISIEKIFLKTTNRLPVVDHKRVLSNYYHFLELLTELHWQFDDLARTFNH